MGSKEESYQDKVVNIFENERGSSIITQSYSKRGGLVINCRITEYASPTPEADVSD